jgi:hypothetical protein
MERISALNRETPVSIAIRPFIFTGSRDRDCIHAFRGLSEPGGERPVAAELPLIPIHPFLESQMTESTKLFVLREKLVGRRRAIVESFHTASVELLAGDEIARIQREIEAVDRAIAEEKSAEFQL